MADRTLRAILTAQSASMVRGFQEAALAAEATGARASAAVEKSASRVGSALNKLGSGLGQLGIVGGGAIAKLGDNFNALSAKGKGLTAVIGEIGKTAAIGGTLGLVAFGAESVKQAGQFQSAMELIRTQAGQSQAEVDKMSKGVLALAGEVGTAPDELAAGLYHLESAGLHGANALKALKFAAEGARMGNANLEDVTNALNAVISSGIKGSGDYEKAMATLNATVGTGDMRLQQLAETFSTGFLAVVRGFGLSLTDVSAALATFGDNLIRGADAGTGLRVAVQAMSVPAKGGAAALAKLGLTSSTLADDLRKGGLNAAVTDLHDRLIAAGYSANSAGQILTEAFGKKAGPALSVMMTEFDKFEGKLDEITGRANTFGLDWKATTGTLQFQEQQLGAETKALATKFGDWLIPKLESTIKFVQRNSGAIKDAAKALGIVLGGAVAVFATQKVVAFVRGVGKMVSALEGFMLKMAASRAGMIAEDGSIVAVGDFATATATKIDKVTASLVRLAARAALPIAVTIAVYEVMKPKPLGKNDVFSNQSTSNVLDQLNYNLHHKDGGSTDVALFNNALKQTKDFVKGESIAVKGGKAVLVGKPKPKTSSDLGIANIGGTTSSAATDVMDKSTAATKANSAAKAEAKAKTDDLKAATDKLTSSTQNLIANALDRAKTSLHNVQLGMSNFASSMTSSLTSGFSFAQADSDLQGAAVGTTFIQSLQSQADKTTLYTERVRELMSAGLSQNALQQVLDAGTDAGTDIADQLLAGGSTAIQKANDLTAAIQGQADQLATSAASQFFGAGVAQARSILKGIERESKVMGPKLKSAANQIAKHLKTQVEVDLRIISQGGKIPGFAKGGTVPGPIGSPTLAIVHGGEHVTPVGGSFTSGGGIVFTGDIILPNVQTPQDFVNQLRQYLRKNGNTGLAGLLP